MIFNLGVTRGLQVQVRQGAVLTAEGLGLVQGPQRNSGAVLALTIQRLPLEEEDQETKCCSSVDSCGF